ncbi:hypothetical protein CKO38_07510 [Rhodospirillum rubrum]|uniref:DUF3179 domain-containing protein n=1 Tax=Rhodospirillum rubrum TaxID=1085 RepID=UPI00190716E1|nr:DUF3179 domain-containing protein [Rhodospirillum rubrum]MBK1666136.1 hypothetical protein [Rhodospirillum rubrum]MBK1676520.1 hypothetical protein [Rhodospirillum rubrum]
MPRFLSMLLGSGALAALLIAPVAAQDAPSAKVPYEWTQEFPKADWSRLRVDPAEMSSGGPVRGGIPAIDAPTLRAAKAIRPLQIGEAEPVIGVGLNGEMRAYPLSVLIWHEVINDTLGGLPIAVTYSPLCNIARVFDRRVGEAVLDFAATGRLRHSCQMLFDRQSESWWEQASARAVSGLYADETLRALPARLESFAAFKARAGEGAMVVIPGQPSKRQYGANPYWGYDRADKPMFSDGPLPDGIAPLARVVAVGERAWALDLLSEKGRIEDGDLVIDWAPGQQSAVDAPLIAKSHAVGGAIVSRRAADGALSEVEHTVPFAFAFHALHPTATIFTRDGR